MADQSNSPSRANAHPISNADVVRELLDRNRQDLMRRAWAKHDMDGSLRHG